MRIDIRNFGTSSRFQIQGRGGDAFLSSLAFSLHRSYLACSVGGWGVFFVVLDGAVRQQPVSTLRIILMMVFPMVVMKRIAVFLFLQSPTPPMLISQFLPFAHLHTYRKTHTSESPQWIQWFWLHRWLFFPLFLTLNLNSQLLTTQASKWIPLQTFSNWAAYFIRAFCSHLPVRSPSFIHFWRALSVVFANLIEIRFSLCCPSSTHLCDILFSSSTDWLKLRARHHYNLQITLRENGT